MIIHSEIEIYRRLTEAEERLKNFRIAGDGAGLDVQGSFKTGFAINAKLSPRPDLEEGDFEGDCVGDLEDLFDVVVDNPFGFTVVWAEITAVSDVSLALLWGPGGGGSIHVPFDADVDLQGNGILSIVGTSTLTRFAVSGGGQHVPALGFLQWNTTDQIAGGVDPAPFHYKIHYIKDL